MQAEAGARVLTRSDPIRTHRMWVLQMGHTRGCTEAASFRLGQRAPGDDDRAIDIARPAVAAGILGDAFDPNLEGLCGARLHGDVAGRRDRPGRYGWKSQPTGPDHARRSHGNVLPAEAWRRNLSAGHGPGCRARRAQAVRYPRMARIASAPVAIGHPAGTSSSRSRLLSKRGQGCTRRQRAGPMRSTTPTTFRSASRPP